MLRTVKRTVISISVACVICIVWFCVFVTASSANKFTIQNIASDVTGASVRYLGVDMIEYDNNAKLTLGSNNTATLEGANTAGYYEIAFSNENAYVGHTNFFLSESGNMYSYTFTENGADYEEISILEYVPYDNVRIFKLNGNGQICVQDLPSNVTLANVYLSQSNGNYGRVEKQVYVDENAQWILF